MSKFRIALANAPIPDTAEESVSLAEQYVSEAGSAGAGIVCFPECYVPGYRAFGGQVPPPNGEFLESAWSSIAVAAKRAGVAVILGTERIEEDGLRISALVVDAVGSIAGFQDKVQLDPSEDSIYAPGSRRILFNAGPLQFGISICHEGWRYPETVRWAARRGAHVVFHPHFHILEPGAHQPESFAESANTFHEKSLLCRAAENTCYIATANCASPGSPTTSAVVQPDGTLQCYQPYGEEGLLISDIELDTATGYLASRFRPID